MRSFVVLLTVMLGLSSIGAKVYGNVFGEELFRLEGDRKFGSSVAVSGNRVLVGDPWEGWGIPGLFRGAVYVLDGTTGHELFKLGASDPSLGDDWFGNTVDISGDAAIISAHSGVYLFDVTTGRELLKLPFSAFFLDVAVDGDTAVVARPEEPAFVSVFSTARMLGDVNRDGEVSGLDIDPFVNLLLNGTYQVEADTNEDGDVNGLDVGPFVTAVVDGGVEQIPETSTCLLALLALGLVGGWRKCGRCPLPNPRQLN